MSRRSSFPCVIMSDSAVNLEDLDEVFFNRLKDELRQTKRSAERLLGALVAKEPSAPGAPPVWLDASRLSLALPALREKVDAVTGVLNMLEEATKLFEGDGWTIEVRKEACKAE